MSQAVRPNQLFIFWIIWISLFSSIFVYQIVIGGGFPSGENEPGAGSPAVLMLGLGSFLVAVGIRLFQIPRAEAVPNLLVTFIVGIAIAEAIALYGLFLVPDNSPQTQRAFFAMSAIGIGIYIPAFLPRRLRGSASRP